jgi:hypothetical protein
MNTYLIRIITFSDGIGTNTLTPPELTTISIINNFILCIHTTIKRILQHELLSNFIYTTKHFPSDPKSSRVECLHLPIVLLPLSIRNIFIKSISFEKISKHFYSGFLCLSCFGFITRSVSFSFSFSFSL